jgi:hypothetical protein
MFILDNHHIDTKHEAVTFINTHITNTIVFLIYIGTKETEQDCTALY